ncbi:hypothetical protein OG948_13435 [Embleya sp. NBC_00888]|uniref:hypothetical protein n=1 Tax=Embleya sp. NBC_00888 TaxID=2975960 RepID=UPI0038632D90|nr:hypothetical protein OG948_13435 [Embleya sp. NBC_00888]
MTRQVAAAHLAIVGITDATMIDRYHQRGGTVLGLGLLRRATDIPNLALPADTVFDLREVLTAGAAAVIRNLPEALRGGFALKFSGHGESFSPECARGRYSSRRRFWDGVDQLQAVAIVDAAMRHPPPGTRAIVFQQYVHDPGLSGVFYAYCYLERLLVEATSKGQRTFTEVTGDRVTRRASVEGPHIRSASTREADPVRVYSILQALRRQLGFDFDIEGFESDGGVIAVQLRPIPNDMPRGVELPAMQKGTGWHRTPLVWGVWENGRAILDADVPGQPAVMIKRTASLAGCPVIMRRLERGDQTLVVDAVDGFRLSHDPCCLPEVVRQRQGFSYISVAGSQLAQLQPGEIVEAFVDGDNGAIRRVP